MQVEVKVNATDDQGEPVELTEEQTAAALWQGLQQYPLGKSLVASIEAAMQMQRHCKAVLRAARRHNDALLAQAKQVQEMNAALDRKRAALEAFAAEPVEVHTVQRGADGRTRRIIKVQSTRCAAAALSLSD